MERRAGKSKLVYDKATRTIVPVRTATTAPATVPPGVMATLDAFDDAAQAWARATTKPELTLTCRLYDETYNAHLQAIAAAIEAARRQGAAEAFKPVEGMSWKNPAPDAAAPTSGNFRTLTIGGSKPPGGQNA